MSRQTQHQHQWWQVARAAATKSGDPELWIYGDLSDDGWGYDGDTEPRHVREALAALGEFDRLTVRINSMGGGVFAGLGINAILAGLDAHVTAQVDGLAASIASVIAMAADEIVMRPGALMMIHNPYSLGVGDGDELRKQADSLDKIRDSLVQVYADRTGKPADEIRELMADATWMGAAEAVAQGFADRIDGAELPPPIAEDRGRFLVLGGVRHPIHKLQEPVMAKIDPKIKAQAEPAPEPVEEHASEVEAEPEAIEPEPAPEPPADWVEQARAGGARAERERLQSIDALAADWPGHGELVAVAKYGPEPMDPAAFTAALLKAEAAKRRRVLADRAADAPSIGDPSDPDSIISGFVATGEAADRNKIRALLIEGINSTRR